MPIIGYKPDGTPKKGSWSNKKDAYTHHLLMGTLRKNRAKSKKNKKKCKKG